MKQLTVTVIISLLALLFAITFYKFITTLGNKNQIIKRLLGGKRNIQVDKSLEAKLLLKKRPNKNKSIITKLEQRLQEAALNMEIHKFFEMCGFFTLIVLAITYLLFKSYIFSLISLLLVPLIINFMLNHLKRKRLHHFTNQLPDIVDFLSSSIKSGYSLIQAINTLAKESSPPASLEFKRVVRDINLGKTYEETFDQLVERNQIEELEIVCTAILLSKETGGNLSHILNTVANTLRDRKKIMGEIKSLTAQGRLSGLILIFLPVVVFIFLWFTNPSYMDPLFTTTMGRMLLGGGIFNEIIGAVLINKIVKIDG